MVDKIFPAPVVNYSKDNINNLLIHVSNLSGVSDIILKSDDKFSLILDGKLVKDKLSTNITEGALSLFLNETYMPSATVNLKQGKDLDYFYSVRVDRKTSIGFRVNACGINSMAGSTGLAIVMRLLPDIPPSLSDLNVDKEISKTLLAIKKGVGLICGATGSGKSTLLASVIRERLVQENLHIVTYESPIEFNFSKVLNQRGIVSQSEIPRHLPSYPAAVRNALRRQPNIILIGESCDKETINGVITASNTGHGVYTTTHTNNAYTAISRMSKAFLSDGMGHVSYANQQLLNCVKFILYQTLVPKVGGGLVAAQELVILNEQNVEKALLEVNNGKNIDLVLKNIMIEDGIPLKQHAQQLKDNNIIDDKTLVMLSK